MKAESWNGVRIKQKKASSDWLVTTHMELLVSIDYCILRRGQVKPKLSFVQN